MPATMAKKRQTAETEGTPDRHKYPVLSARPTAEMRRVLQAYAKRERRSVSQVVLLLLERALAAEGLWPPAQE
jgi:cytochrome c553